MRSYLILTTIISVLMAGLYSVGRDHKKQSIVEKTPYEFVFVRKVDDHYLLYKHRTLNICLLVEPTHSGGKTQVDCSLIGG